MNKAFKKQIFLYKKDNIYYHTLPNKNIIIIKNVVRNVQQCLNRGKCK